MPTPDPDLARPSAEAGIFTRKPHPAFAEMNEFWASVGNDEPSERHQALAEAAEFLRPAEHYRSHPEHAQRDIARLIAWIEGQGVELNWF